MDGNQPAQDARILEIQQRSAPAGTTSQELIKYVLVELDVPRKNHQEFQNKMPDLVELMFDHKGWELVFASYPITGKVNRFVHIWKIPDESGLVEVMRDGAVDLSKAQLRGASELDLVFRECYLGVQDLAESTKHRLMTSLPYDPTHVGFQSQTTVIDVEEEPFIIEHATLRKSVGKIAGLSDISNELEDVRVAKFTRRNRANEAMPKDKSSKERVAQRENKKRNEKKEKESSRVQALQLLQQHLNRGSVAARLTFEGKQALLFNLASLKPRSVYQAVEFDEKAKKVAAPVALVPKGDGKVDLKVERLLIAMPWGGIYDVDEAALQQLAQPIPAKHVSATDAALKPIVEGFAPVAAIPEERDTIIGDGCACYVINLASFVR